MYSNSTELEAANLSRLLVNQLLCCEKRMIKTISLYVFKSRNNSKILFYYRISVNLGFGYNIQTMEQLSMLLFKKDYLSITNKHDLLTNFCLCNIVLNTSVTIL